MAKYRARLWVILAVGVLSGACTAQDLGEQYTEVSEEESGILFYGPGTAGGYRQFLTGRNAQFDRQTFATYGPKSGEFPMAVMSLSETSLGRHFTRVQLVRETVEGWNYFDNKTIVPGVTGTAVNAMGRIDYHTFTADGISCVNWLQTMGRKDDGGVGTIVLAGYYCKGKGPAMADSEAISIVKRLGHHKHGPIEPPPGWLATGNVRINTNFDGPWHGTMMCGTCENCVSPLTKEVQIDIQQGSFEIFTDSTYHGEGAVDKKGNMEIHYGAWNDIWTVLSPPTFEFAGQLVGRIFQLEGTRGSRTCNLSLSRLTS